MPNEGHEDSISYMLVKMLPFLDNFCVFEICFMLKSVIYPNIFHSALHISRLIDKPPEQLVQIYTKNASKHLTKAMATLDMITLSRMSDATFVDKILTKTCVGDPKIKSADQSKPEVTEKEGTYLNAINSEKPSS